MNEWVNENWVDKIFDSGYNKLIFNRTVSSIMTRKLNKIQYTENYF
jgi:hypothetical protein